MQYRRFGKLDWKASALGFGCMRLPTEGGDSANINEAETIRMIHYAIDHGVNYFDTAYSYHGGNSERVLGRALKGGHREKVRVATKLPCWKVEAAGDFDPLLNEQLEKLQTDHIDFYLLHGLNGNRWPKMRDLGVLDWAAGAIADGRIGYLGFSFHDTYDAFKEIVDAHNWTFCQVQHNYMDVEYQAGTKGLQYAAAKGMAVVIMEPLLGGALVDPPPQIQALWNSAAKKRSAADWALQWLWNQPEVSVVLSGMSAMQQVEENVACADASGVGTLTAEELALVARVRVKFEELCPILCTQCEYCMPCPNGVNIPRNFKTYNGGLIYDKLDHARGIYRWLSQDMHAGADACIQCCECEDKCPQSIPISEWMPVVRQVLGEGKPYEACPMPQG
jgi:predicted aldo/keto reductase-like oxidoreductase